MEQFEEHHKKTKLLIEEYKQRIYCRNYAHIVYLMAVLPKGPMRVYNNKKFNDYPKINDVYKNYWYTDPQVLKEQYKSELYEYFYIEIKKYLIKDLIGECFSFVI